jgi:hypothetical protein
MDGRKERLGWTCEITGSWRLIRLLVGERSGQFWDGMASIASVVLLKGLEKNNGQLSRCGRRRMGMGDCCV